jgi:integrase/recombinase XerD
MKTAQQQKFQSLYRKHVNALQCQGKDESTIEVYSRALHRVNEFWDACSGPFTQKQFETWFAALVQTHSRPAIKVDRNGQQFFYKHVPKRDWAWVYIVKPPQQTLLPDVLTLKEIERLIIVTGELRYPTIVLVTFIMGLRLSETSGLQVGEIDSGRMKVLCYQGKGRKDRSVTLPDFTLLAWLRYWLFDDNQDGRSHCLNEEDCRN